MTETVRHDADPQDAAARWHARMTSDRKTSRDEAAFDAWLAADAAHADAYAELCAMNGRLEALGDRAAIRVAVAEAEDAAARARVWARRRRILGPLAGAGLAACAALAFVSLTAVEREAWTTAPGEIRDIAFSDGTEATLGSNTRLSLEYRRGGRTLSIERGQAFFKVAHDKDRPFTVYADERTVTALGTAFDVRAFDGELIVTLLSGKVSVAYEGEGASVTLTAGQQFRAQNGASAVRDVDPDVALGWRGGVLEFDETSLAEAVKRFNRNSGRAIMIADPALETIRISGVFRSDDAEGFVAALTIGFPIEAHEQSSGDYTLMEKL